MDERPDMPQQDYRFGSIESTLKAHADRMDRTEARQAAEMSEIRMTLAGHDTKLDQLLQKQDTAAGERAAQTRFVKTALTVIGFTIPATGLILEIVKWHVFF